VRPVRARYHSRAACSADRLPSVPPATKTPPALSGQPARSDNQRNAWFSDLALGMFIHWSMDVQLGSVISHSMVGASPDYLQRYIELLPRTFNLGVLGMDRGF